MIDKPGIVRHAERCNIFYMCWETQQRRECKFLFYDYFRKFDGILFSNPGAGELGVLGSPRLGVHVWVTLVFLSVLPGGKYHVHELRLWSSRKLQFSSKLMVLAKLVPYECMTEAFILLLSVIRDHFQHLKDGTVPSWSLSSSWQFATSRPTGEGGLHLGVSLATISGIFAVLKVLISLASHAQEETVVQGLSAEGGNCRLGGWQLCTT